MHGRVHDYQLHLVARGLKASTICPIMSALRFLYAVTPDRPEQAARIPLPRKADPLPAILSQDEVARPPGAVLDLWMCALLARSRSAPPPPCGATPGCRWCRSAGCCCATPGPPRPAGPALHDPDATR